MAESLPIARSRDHRLLAYLAFQIVIAAFCISLFRLSPPTPPLQYRLAGAEISEDGVSWQPIELPHTYEHAGTARTRADPAPLLYRMRFDRSPSDNALPWSLFLPRFTSSAEVAINGTVILDTRRNPGARRLNRNSPAIALIPQALLRDDANEVTVRLFVWGPLTGYLDSAYVGPDAELRPAYDKRIFLFATIPLVLAVWQGTIGTILGLIWLNRRHETAYGWLAAAMAIGAAQHFIVPQPAYPALQGFLAAAGTLESALALLFAARLANLRSSALEWLAFFPGLAILATGLFRDPADLWTIYMVLGPASIGLFVILIALILGWSAVAKGEKSSFFLGSTLTVVVVFWAHDVLTVLNALPGERIFLGRLSYSAVLIAIGIGLTWRIVQALNEADSFAGRLVLRVREAEEKLRASFAREEERARNEALAAERTRLMRDLHDGLGGQLVSIVALTEQMGREGTAIGDAARAALKDLRLVIDAMEEIDGDLMLALGSWRERISAQLRAHGIRLSWQVAPGGLPVFPGLRPWHVIQIVRLIDEAVTNAIRHSGATTLRVIVEAAGDKTGKPGGRITIEDDGKGFDLDAPRPAADAGARAMTGRGLPNMRQRAERCGARLAMSSGPSGTRVSLWLPGDLGMSATGETPGA
ncbi:sensor histidine kinase [Pseudochelatococcus sp. B33]